MPNYQVISRSSHGNKRWLRATSFAFAMKDALLPLSLAELPKAVITLPIAFLHQEDRYLPVAVMSIQPDRNHCVARDGRWLHGYIPAYSRCYPFRMANSGSGEPLLCIDADAGLISEGPEGEPFFDDEGGPSPAIKEVMGFLYQLDTSMKATLQACAILDKHHLIKPWPITLQTDAGDKQLSGLFQIDESALNNTSAEVLHELNHSGALPLAYCQLLSTQHLPVLAKLAQAHAQAEQAAAEAAKKIETNGELNLEFLNQSDSLNFGGFR